MNGKIHGTVNEQDVTVSEYTEVPAQARVISYLDLGTH